MTPRNLLLAAAVATFALPVLGEGTISVTDAYARAAGPTARTGAAFMVIANSGTEEDRLIGVRSEAAERVELHTHIINAEGVARMVEVEDGFPIPAGGSHALERGGDHVMFLGLTTPFEQGALIPVTLVFERAGEVAVDIPVDLDRMPGHGAMHGTGG